MKGDATVQGDGGRLVVRGSMRGAAKQSMLTSRTCDESVLVVLRSGHRAARRSRGRAAQAQGNGGRQVVEGGMRGAAEPGMLASRACSECTRHLAFRAGEEISPLLQMQDNEA
jgi:hypothetical protein